jgi:hypothetical protein
MITHPIRGLPTEESVSRIAANLEGKLDFMLTYIDPHLRYTFSSRSSVITVTESVPFHITVRE